MIGIDVGTNNVKLCRVEKKKKGYEIVAALMTRNPLVGRQGDENKAELSRKIKTLANEAAMLSGTIALSLGGSQILARNFTVPSLSQAELKGAVRLQADQTISSGLDSMYWDFQSLAALGDGQQDVLFVGVPKESIESVFELLHGTGLEAGVIDIDNLALVNCYLTFDPNAREESVILLDIGHRSTNISIIDHGKVRFIRNVDCGGKDITSEISRMYELPKETAEKIKKRPDLWTECGLNIKNILRKSMPDALEAVYRSLEYCMSRKKLINVDKILITGGSASLFGLKGFISEALGIHTEKWNPLDHLEIKGELRKNMGQFLGVALGLALREEESV